MNQLPRTGIILMNLGSPDSTAVKDVKKYLDEFLMDERVIDYPYLIRALLVKALIVPSRSAGSAEAYKEIWTKDGSPLVHLTKELKKALEEKIDFPVEVAMRYGNPAPAKAFENLLQKQPDLDEVILVSLYPHYAMSSYETAVEYARKIHAKKKYKFKLTVIKPFYNDELYLEALTESIRPFIQKEYDHFLFSYHGIPERHILKGDITKTHCLQSPDCCSIPSPAHKQCYRHQCFETTKLVAEKLQLPAGKFSVSFQSRLGRAEWLKPYTALQLAELPSKGIKKLLIVCPAFVSDCLETLEEIAMEGKETFLHAGGEEFTMIPCLNVSSLWVNAIVNWTEGIRKGSEEMILSK
ncbi:MAG: ferrochelatase [Chitinophagaceae bacterium]|nr:ferrochelatase [Chitinophagaceae bacterium]